APRGAKRGNRFAVAARDRRYADSVITPSCARGSSGTGEADTVQRPTYLINSFLMLTHDDPVARIRKTRAAGPMLNIAISLPRAPAAAAPLKYLVATALHDSPQY